jgi:hypothetical protein
MTMVTNGGWRIFDCTLLPLKGLKWYTFVPGMVTYRTIRSRTLNEDLDLERIYIYFWSTEPLLGAGSPISAWTPTFFTFNGPESDTNDP